jgi:O-antigen biosynthesis protein
MYGIEMFRMQRLTIEPLANISLRRVEEKAPCWRADTDDPQLRIRLAADSGTVPAGWYSFSVNLDVVSGYILAPCVYADYGEGWSEQTRIPLWFSDTSSIIEGIIVLPREARQLRFDPSLKQVEFCLGAVRLKRIGRISACIGMMKTLADADRGAFWSNLCRVSAGTARSIWKSGLKQTGTYLRGRYLDLLRSAMGGYGYWIRHFDAPRQLPELSKRAERLAHRPRFSILLPTYNTPEKWLRKCLDSVVSQAYPDWELCVADDASSQPHVRRVLQEYASKDSRIRIVFRETNGHISEASNSSLQMASYEYVALLDHDDEIPPHALLEVAEAIVANPEWQLVYSDEDKIDETGRRFDPYFKPDWNYDFLLAQNCICHLGVYKTDLVRSVGGFRKGFEGSQDWDLALRVVERLKPEQIGHIPKVLYHWRAIEGSTAIGVGEKNYAVDAGRRAVEEHILRAGKRGRMQVLANGHLRVRYELPEAPPMVSLVIPTRDKVELLRMCIGSILEKSTYPSFEILVVDNQSAEPETLAYFEELRALPNVKVLSYDAPFNYSAINNYAVAHARGEVIGLVNNDIEVIASDWLEEMVTHALRPDVGAVGAMLYYPDDTIQHAGVIVGLGGVAGHAYLGLPRGSAGYFSRALVTQEISAVTAACLLVRREVFDAVEGLDTGLSVAFNDIDLCLRIRRAGYRNIWTPFAELYHHESASRGYEDTPEKLKRFQGEINFMQTRWGSSLTQDPAYNLNLSLVYQFELAFPPRGSGQWGDQEPRT